MTNTRKKHRYSNIFFKALQRSRLTIKDFADELGVSKMTLWRWLNYAKCPNLESYQKATRVLKKYLPDETFDIFAFKKTVSKQKKEK